MLRQVTLPGLGGGCHEPTRRGQCPPQPATNFSIDEALAGPVRASLECLMT